MRQDEWDELRRRFDYRCAYCGVRESDAGAELTVDHFQPHSRGGVKASENWVYSCHACNEFKGDYWSPGTARRILHPHRDDLSEHIAESADGTLQPLTETGAFHVDRLHLNRHQLVNYRRERRALDDAFRTRKTLLRRLLELEGQVGALTAALEQINPRPTQE